MGKKRIERSRASAGDVVLGEDFRQRLLKTTEACHYLAVTRDKLYALVRREDDPLPCLHVGAQRRFQADEIDRWVARQGPRRAVRMRPEKARKAPRRASAF